MAIGQVFLILCGLVWAREVGGASCVDLLSSYFLKFCFQIQCLKSALTKHFSFHYSFSGVCRE